MPKRIHLHLVLLLIFLSFSAGAQLLRNSPAEDTMVYYYPLDSAQLQILAAANTGLDTEVLYRHPAIRFSTREETQKKGSLPEGTYLRSSIYGFLISRSIYEKQNGQSISYISDGDQSFVLVKDRRSNRLVKHLKLYFNENAQLSSFAAGRGGYPVMLPADKDKPVYFLMNDKGVWTLKLFSVSKNVRSKTDPEDEQGGYYPITHPNASYLILSKPKYKPGDTLSAYTYQIVGKRGRPIHGRMEASIFDNNGTVYWKGKIKPKKAGSYRLNFPIPDSFTLNQAYTVSFRYFFNEQWHEHHQSFVYEDYKLEKTVYDLWLSKNAYKAGDSINCLLSARDENGFADPFGKYQIDVYIRSIWGISRDTLGFNLNKPVYHFEASLNGEGVETINIPADRLPQGNCLAFVTCKLTNEQNEELSWTREFNYDNNPHEWQFRQEADTLFANYLYLQRPVSRQLHYVTTDFLGDTIENKSFQTPLKLQVRANYAKISFWDSGKVLYELPVQHNIEEAIGLQTYQNGDSVYISFQSHGDETVYYTILKNGKAILADSGISLRFRAAAGAKDHYELLYAVEMQQQTNAFVNYRHFHIIPNTRKLSIEDNLPGDVVPGSDISVQLKIKDFRGKPLKNVDLSSYGFKSRFKNDEGTMQFFIFPPMADTLYERVKPADWELSSIHGLNKDKSRLITLADIKQYDLFRYPYYQFYYRTEKIYREDYTLKGAQNHRDSTAVLGLTIGFAGKIYSPVWISADGKPIFYAATSRECLAMLPAGKHTLQFQLSNVLYELEPMDFLPGHKKMIHINQDSGEVALPGLRILRKDMPTLELDSGMRENILRHSLLINNLPVLFDKNRAPARLRFPNMTRHMSPSGIGEMDLEGTMFKFVGPYYETKAVMTMDSIIRSLPMGDGLLHFYIDSAAQIASETLPVPQQPWLATVREYQFEELFDTLYWPPLPVVTEKYTDTKFQQTEAGTRPEQAVIITPQFRTYWSKVDGEATQLEVFDNHTRLSSMAIVSKTNIAQSSFSLQSPSKRLSHPINRNGVYDLYFQLSDGTERVYKNVDFSTYSHFYINIDSLKGTKVSESDLRFYNNAYLSLNGSFDEYFTNYPDKAIVRFSKTQGARNNTVLTGRLRASGSDAENIYLEKDGHFVAGAQTDENGNFQFLNIAPGTYMIKVHNPGSHPLYVYNLRLESNTAYTIDIARDKNEAPLLLAAGNKHYRLDVWQKPDSGFVRFINSDTRESIVKGTITFKVAGKTVHSCSVSSATSTFPILNWPEGKAVDILVEAPGFVPLQIKDLKPIPNFSYQWQFLLTPLLTGAALEQAIFIQGALINNALPTVNSTFQNLDTIRPGVYGPNYEIHLRAEDSEGQLVIPTSPLICHLYRDNKLLQSVRVAAGPDILLFRPEMAGSYILRVASEGMATQIISFTLTGKGKYYILLDPFTIEKISPAKTVAFKGKRKLADNYNRGERSSGDHSNYIEAAPSTSSVEMAGLSRNVYQVRSGAALNTGGARADGTVYLIDGQVTHGNIPYPETTIQAAMPRQALSAEQSAKMKANPAALKLREHFSDASHFVTGLRTNKSGKTEFHIVFPDDITQWDLFQTALGKHYVFGNSKKKVSAFKPVMAIVRTPRYLYQGDNTEIGLNLRNLTETAKEADWQTSVDSQIILHHSGTLIKGLSDSGYYHATHTGDIRFYSGITTSDSFTDRELRTIPVLRPAVDVYTDTSFAVVDTTFTVARDSTERVQVTISQTLNDYFYQTIASLEAYPYACVEQQCSKILGLLYAEKLAKHTGQQFSKRRQLKKMIEKLQEFRSGDGGYGWWKGQSNVPMSLIVYETLQSCAEAGYDASSRSGLRSYLIKKISSADSISRFSILASLLSRGEDIHPYKPYVEKYQQGQFSGAADRLNFLMVNGSIKDSFNRRDIFLCLQMMQQNMRQELQPVTFTQTPTVRLLHAFRLFRYTSLADSISPYMQHFIDGGFHMRTRNTYEQSLTLQTFYEFALRKQEKSKSYYRINKGKEQRIFPLQLNLTAAATELRYKGLKGWVRIDRIRALENPAAKDTFFKVSARMQNMDGTETDSLLLNGNYQIQSNVYNYKTYEHVMVSVPIPAGMSLKHKIPLPPGVSHIDYFTDRIVLYYEQMKSGNHSCTIPLRATFRGEYVWAPIRAELMYQSQVYGHNTFRKISIR
jgi:hypothetical protein